MSGENMDDDITPPPQPVDSLPGDTPPPSPPPPPPSTSRPFNAVDHYNAAADALQQITLHHQDENFGLADATIFIQLALTHGLLGQLKLSLDKKC